MIKYVFNLNTLNGLSPATYATIFVHPECCKTDEYGNGFPTDYYVLESTPTGQYLTLPEAIQNNRTVVTTFDGNTYWVANSGKICCKRDISNSNKPNEDCNNFATCNWRLAGIFPNPSFEQGTIEIGGERYLKFVDPSGAFRVVSPTGNNCAYSTAISGVFDPFTGQFGFGCKVTTSDWGINYFVRNETYKRRFLGVLSCGSEFILETETANPTG